LALRPGDPKRFEFVEYGASILWDGRDAPFYARRGSLVQASVTAGDGIRDTREAWTKYAVEVQRYISLPGERRSLAVRLRGVATDDRSNGGLGVPLFRLERLGGSRT